MTWQPGASEPVGTGSPHRRRGDIHGFTRDSPPLPALHVLPTPLPARVAPSLLAKLTVVTVQPGDSLWKLAAQDAYPIPRRGTHRE